VVRWESRFTNVALVAALISFGGPTFAGQGNPQAGHRKLDRELNHRAGKPGTSRVIIRLTPGWDGSEEIKRLGGRIRRRLEIINGHAVQLPNRVIKLLADHPAIQSIHYDRPTGGEMNRTAVTVGARAVQFEYGYTGAGVGVAVIDSGVTSWHDDLAGAATGLIRTKDGKRVPEFIDFVNGLGSTSYDDNGHGTHVSGVINGNGDDSLGAYAGIAPQAHVIGLKVLDAHGSGVISDVIAALKWVYDNRTGYNIRVVNLSVGAAVTESYNTDPLTLAVKRVVDAGVVVVCAAGNLGKNALDQIQYGGITAPANAPWVLTVGASSHEGTVTRGDDVVAGYSSRGPTAIDFQAKPDIVAPGTGIVSLADRSSLLYVTKSQYLLQGSEGNPDRMYLSLTGTSMAAPAVAGTVALMMQANPSLTPNMVKAIVQYTAQKHANYDLLTQGAGFLNTHGAVRLARFFRTATSGSSLSMPPEWSKHVLWGTRRISGGVIRPNANAFQLGTTWGASTDRDGDNIVWGTVFGSNADNIIWGTFDALGEDNIVWGTQRDDNGDNIVWGTHNEGDNIIWGTAADVENIVWGTDCGGADCDNIVWGTAATGEGDNIVWGTAEGVDNIIWGTNGEIDNIVWGTSKESDNVTWGNSGEDTPLFDDPTGAPKNFDQTPWSMLFATEPAAVVPTTEPNPSTGPETSTLTSAAIAGGGF
jgi:serine protease AprX